MSSTRLYIQVDGVGLRDLGDMIEANAEESNGDYLTAWESDFSASMLDSYMSWKNTNWMTPAQLNNVERIYKKLHKHGAVK